MVSGDNFFLLVWSLRLESRAGRLSARFHPPAPDWRANWRWWGPDPAVQSIRRRSAPAAVLRRCPVRPPAALDPALTGDWLTGPMRYKARHRPNRSPRIKNRLSGMIRQLLDEPAIDVGRGTMSHGIDQVIGDAPALLPECCVRHFCAVPMVTMAVRAQKQPFKIVS